MESENTAAGVEPVVVDMGFAKVGISICYDLRFPELYAHLRSKMGAEVLLIPAAFTVPTGSAHWEVLLRSRAIENQCVVVAAAQHGTTKCFISVHLENYLYSRFKVFITKRGRLMGTL